MMSKLLNRLFLAAVVAAGLLLAGCNDAPGTATGSPPAKSAAEPVSLAAIEAGAKGFSVGALMSKRTVYIFFDAQCPHCGALWEAAKPLKSQARFVWIPVGVLNAASTAQGATLLAAADPVAAMDEHETSLQARRGGISAGSNIDAQKEAVAKNTELMTRLGFASIPTIVGTHAQTGATVSHEGSLSTAALATLLGL
jgi:thiol:disulfide interchange protein DsbG